MVDGDEPREACQPVEDATYMALLARQTGRLPVGTVEEIGPHQQEDAYEVVQQPQGTIVVETALSKEPRATRPNEHRGNGDGVRMYIEMSEKTSQLEAEGTDYMKVEPVLSLGGFQRLIILVCHRIESFEPQR